MINIGTFLNFCFLNVRGMDWTCNCNFELMAFWIFKAIIFHVNHETFKKVPVLELTNLQVDRDMLEFSYAEETMHAPKLRIFLELFLQKLSDDRDKRTETKNSAATFISS